MVLTIAIIAIVVAGILVIIVPFFLLPVIDEIWEQRKKSARPSDSQDVIFISEVTIAGDLVPLVLGLSNLKGSTIRILGDDGSYIVSKNGNILKKGMHKWIAEGLRIEYVLLSLGDGVEEALRILQSELGGEDAFDVRILDDDAVFDDNEMRALLGEFRTEHPTLFLGHDGKNALWLEGHHPPRSIHAYNVRYVSPNAMTHEWSEKFDAFKRKTDRVLEFCRELPRCKEAA